MAAGVARIMMYYFPAPYPDELIGSWLLRGCRHLGIPLKLLTHFIFFDGVRRSSRWPPTMPRALSAVSAATGIDTETLLWEHTQFPYATAYSSPEQTDTWTRNLMFDGARGNSALSHSTFIGIEGLRYCEQCADSSQQQHGETYWRRAHNLPFVAICHTHGTYLRVVRRDNPTHPIVFLPGDNEDEPVENRLPPDWELRIASLSTQLLQTRRRRHPEAWYNHYRRRAILKGVKRLGSDLASRQIAEAFRTRFGNAFLANGGLEFKGLTQPWPMLMLRPGQSEPFSTPKHVLLTVFLELGDLAEDYVKYRKRAADYAALDTQYRHLIAVFIDKQRETHQRITLKEMLMRLGIYQSISHSRAKLPQTTELIRAFKASELSARQTGRRPRARLDPA